jgi:23S rRNA (cytosine1962-C5)-methyltransferase
MTTLNAILLKPGREKPVQQGHPWVFSGAIRHLPDSHPDGAIVDVHAHDGQWLARGYLNRRSQIQVRLLTWQREEAVDEAFWRARIRRAMAGRAGLYQPGHQDGVRLINGESDGLPGLVVDRMADYLVMQVGTLGMDQRKQMLAALLLTESGCQGVVERSDLSLRSQEGLTDATGILAGTAPPQTVIIREAGLAFEVDLLQGQKTGFYLDQRLNRQAVARYCLGKRVLNAFAYTGGFGIHALAQGAQHITNLDSSGEALALGEANLARNGFGPDQATSVAGDAFEVLRFWRYEEEARGNFDVIVLDPPKFANTKRQVDGALRGYKDINRLAFELLAPGGILATFSCTGLVDADLFQKVIFAAAVDAGREVQILEWLHQPPDHPVALSFPEGAYLKGLITRVVGKNQEIERAGD